VRLPSIEVTVYIFAEVRYSWEKLLARAEADFSTQHSMKISRFASILALSLPKEEMGVGSIGGSPSGRK
jgi:hypothetical protein